MININKPKSITDLQICQIRSKLSQIDDLIFCVGIETGLRISDILNLKKSDLKTNPFEITESKTKKTRSISLSEPLYCVLKAWGDINQGYVFANPTDANKRYSRMTYHRHLKKVCPDASAHSTRKYFAQALFRRKMSIFAVQEALGHKYLATTAVYLDIDIEKLIINQLPH